MSFSSTVLDEIRHRISLVSIVAKRVRLARSGKQYVGLCPFHEEKRPSFMVNEEKGFYHCFGCSSHGDVISFVMRVENITFVEAVRYLTTMGSIAARHDVGCKQDKSLNTAHQKKLISLMEVATTFFEQQLYSPAGKEALAYLYKRGLSDAVIARFRLGFSPKKNSYSVALKKHDGVDDNLLKEAGLLMFSQDRQQVYATFRDRIIFPITNVHGQVVAFGGRALGTIQPKYFNTPDTPLFRKSEILYGLAQAHSPAVRTGTLIITEGYMDVITLANSNFPYVVATLGTAMTIGQIITVWRLVSDPILCFDGDTAGCHATDRLVDKILPLLKAGISLRFAQLPEGKDPDDVLQEQGATFFASVLKDATPLCEKIWHSLVSGRIFNTPEKHAALEQAINETTNHIVDPIVRKSYKDLLHRWRYTLFKSSTEKKTSGYYFIPKEKKRTVFPSMVNISTRLLLSFLLAYPQVLVSNAKEILVLLDNYKERELLELAVYLLTKCPDNGMDGIRLIAVLTHFHRGAAVKSLKHYLVSEFQRRRQDPVADCQSMLVALYDQSLARKIEDMQVVLSMNPSLENWRHLQLLQEERLRLYEGDNYPVPIV